MSLLTASALRQSWGDFDLFRNVTLSIADGAKIGLVGPNGVGKTTLVQMLAGLTEPTSGQIAKAKGCRIGYLPQEAMAAFSHPEHRVLDEALAVFEDLRRRETALRDMEEAMADELPDEDRERLLSRYSNDQAAFEHAGGYTYEQRTRHTLLGLGFSEAEDETPVAQLSGGQKTRLLLAKLLLEAPELLILDEPTNHLDIKAVEWLEDALLAWDGAVLMVSHDRYFLDKVVSTIWELSAEGLAAYRGNYSAFVMQKEERHERQAELFEAEIARLAKDLDYAKRHMNDQNRLMALGKLKRLTRDIVAIEAVGVSGKQGKKWSELDLGRQRPLGIEEAERRLKALRKPEMQSAHMSLRLGSGVRGGDIVLRAEGVVIGYPGRELVRADEVLLERGERVAILGPNGSGKTTLLRTLRGDLEPLSGRFVVGNTQKLGYFAQAHDTLSGSGTVLDELLRIRNMPLGEARSYLAAYLFRGEDVYKSVGSLSGGERSRLALAILALDGANLLLLDEPTNHLDIPAREVLEEVLSHFPGTLLVVSHDRYLVDHLATRIWAVENGELVVYPGGYQEYLEASQSPGRAAGRRDGAKRDAGTKPANGSAGPASERKGTKSSPANGLAASASGSTTTAAPSGSGSAAGAAGARGAIDREAAKAAERAARRRAAQLAALEADIAAAEAEVLRLGAALQAAGEAGDFEQVGALSTELQQVQTKLDGLWAALAEVVA